MICRSTQNARRELSDLARTQGGYFTAKQAAAVGYGKRHLDYHVKPGNFERVQRGLFRLPGIPPSEHDDLIRLSLGSRGRDDRPQVVVSQETALAVHGLLTVVTASRVFRTDDGESTAEDASTRDPEGDDSIVFETDGHAITRIARIAVRD